MNRITNHYGALNTDTGAGFRCDEITSQLYKDISQLINSHRLDADEIMALEHQLHTTVGSACSEHILRFGLNTRKAERASTTLPAPLIENKRIENKRMTPKQWSELFGVEVIDPDGWRNGSNITWLTPITQDMFIARYNASTVRVIDRERHQQWRHLFG